MSQVTELSETEVNSIALDTKVKELAENKKILEAIVIEL